MKKLLLLLLCGPGLVFAGPTEKPAVIDESAKTMESPWAFRITPYAWLVSTSGSVGAGPLSANAGLSDSKILSDLRFGFMLDIEVDYERWSLENDIIYASLSLPKSSSGIHRLHVPPVG
jgi:hypothetical protein